MLFPSWQIISSRKTNDQTELKKKAVTNYENLRSIRIKIIVLVVVLAVANNLLRSDVQALSSSSSTLDHKSLTGIAVCKKRADGEENFRNGEGRAPVVFQDVQTDHALAVNITVINSGSEGNLEENAKLI